MYEKWDEELFIDVAEQHEQFTRWVNLNKKYIADNGTTSHYGRYSLHKDEPHLNGNRHYSEPSLYKLFLSSFIICPCGVYTDHGEECAHCSEEGWD